MIKLLVLSLTILLTFSVHAADATKESYDFLAKKIMEDFHNGVKIYNANKEPNAPAIKRGGGKNYNLIVSTHRVNFTIVNYLNDEMYVDGRLVQRSTFGSKLEKKTTWSNPFISEAIADDGDLDAATTRIILTALGALNKNLEDVGMMCFAGCVRQVKTNNIKKVLLTLSQQHETCNQQMYAQEDTIKKFPSYQMVSLLHSTFNPEFQSIKELMQKISETNKKKVDEFMTKKMVVEKKYESCVGVMASGTLADSAASAGERGMQAILAKGVSGEVIERELENAKEACVKMDELKSCLITLKKNLTTINSIRREEKKKGSTMQEESLPSVDAISR